MFEFLGEEDKILVLLNVSVNNVPQSLSRVGNGETKIIKSADYKTYKFEPSFFNWILTFDDHEREELTDLLKIVAPGGSIVLHKFIDNSKGYEEDKLFCDDILSLTKSGFRFIECRVSPVKSEWKLEGLFGENYHNRMAVCQIIGEKPH